MANSDSKSESRGKNAYLAEVNRVYAIRFKRSKLTSLVLLAHKEIDAIRLQLKRINAEKIPNEQHTINTRNMTDEESQEYYEKNMRAYFADIRFLLVCLRRMGNFLHQFEQNLQQEPEIIELKRHYGDFFEKVREPRNYMEHIDERIMNPNLLPKEFEYLDTSIYGEAHFDASEKTQQIIEPFFEDFLTACEAVSRRQWASNPTTLNSLKNR